jgi:hypothetical protein
VITHERQRTEGPAVPNRPVHAAALPAGGLMRAARSQGVAGVTAAMLQRRRVGNRAVARILARVKRYAGLYENPKYASTVYPYREGLLKRFVSIYRYMELKEAGEEQVKAAWDTVRKAMQAELDRLAALPTPTKEDAAKKKEIEGVLKQTKLSFDQMAYKSGEWEARLLAGGNIWKEVQRHFAAGRVPEWFKPMVQHYTGMRYLSAHGHYHSPRRLLYVLAFQEAEAAADPKVVKQKKVKVDPAKVAELKGLSDEAVLQRLRDLRSQAKIPDAAWRTIVDASELRLDAEGPATETGDEKSKLEGDWAKNIKRWKDGDFSDPLTGEAGSRAWLTELMRSGSMVMLGVVCNQLAEASARQRGIKLTSGISQNAGDFQAAAAKGAGATPELKDGKAAVQPYFRHAASDDDFRPGANLFFIDGDWVDADPGNHAIVRYVAGHDYPVAPTPEYIKEWKAWKAGDEAYKKAKGAWDAKAKKAKTDAEKAKLPAEPEAYTVAEPTYHGRDKLPNDGETVEGWTYQVKPGAAITRTHPDGRQQWMKWSHQATVIKRVGARVFTFETVDDSTWGRGSGMGERTTASLKKLSVFVAWMSGNEPQYEAPSTAPAAAPGPAPATSPTPATPPPASPPVSGPTCEPAPSPDPVDGPSCAMPEPDQETQAERDARMLAPAR